MFTTKRMSHKIREALPRLTRLCLKKKLIQTAYAEQGFVSYFLIRDSSMHFARNCLKHLRSIRHPYVLRVLEVSFTESLRANNKTCQRGIRCFARR